MLPSNLKRLFSRIVLGAFVPIVFGLPNSNSFELLVDTVNVEVISFVTKNVTVAALATAVPVTVPLFGKW
jgi:hypothetical protein